MGKYIPSSLKNFKFHIKNIREGSYFEFLIRQIGLLLNNGWRYSEVLNIKELRALFEEIKSKLINEKIFTNLDQIIAYVYTRDLPAMPFGSWIRISCADILTSFEYSVLLKKNTQSDFHPIKIAGFIVALKRLSEKKKVWDFSQWLENSKAKLGDKGSQNSALQRRVNVLKNSISNDDFTLINNPERFYFFADIKQANFKLYADMLNIKYGYDNFQLNGELKVRLFIWNYTELLNEVFNANHSNSLMNTKICESMNTKLINFQVKHSVSDIKIWNELASEFDRRFMNKYHQYLTKSRIEDFPYYRLNSFDEVITLIAPERLFNYKLALSILVGQHIELLKKNGLSLDRRTLFNNKKIFENIQKLLISNNLLGQYHPQSAITYNQVSNKHFDQINKAHKIIQDMSSNGIFIDTKKLGRINATMFGERLEGLNQVSLFDKYNSTDKNSIVNRFIENEKYASLELKEIYKNLENAHIPERIFGTFTTHKANTHRMTCHNLNLQGISKDIKREAFSAPRGWKLLNADVSGQDLVVAANLALKLYNDFQIRDLISNTELRKLKLKIISTLGTLSNTRNPKCRPIDFITDKLLPGLKTKYYGYDRKAVRDLLKKIQYSFFYGGGINTLLEEMKEEIFLKMITSKEFNEISDIKKRWNIKRKGTVRIDREGIFRDVKDLIVKLESIELDLIDNPDPNDPILNWNEIAKEQEEIVGPGGVDYAMQNIAKNSRQLSVQRDLNILSNILNSNKYKLDKNLIRELFNSYVENLNRYYPGILESFSIYRRFCELNNYYTCPSLLGYQTIIDGENPGKQNNKLVHTKGKAYPVQISGAEFMRQWLIELSRGKGYNSTYKLVNAIHDQVYLEVKNIEVNRIKKVIVETSKNAAKKVGIDPRTLHLSDIEIQ